jgi:hypothetical protein
MPKMRSRQAVGLAVAALCASSVGCFTSAPTASSATTTALPKSHVSSRTRSAASEGATGRGPSARPIRLTTTSVTVMGGGTPSSWPAAKKVAPSLAGAYSPNLKTAFLTLVRYSDWLGSHPNPNLVKNYVLPTSDIYWAQVYLMRDLVSRGWHEPPNPTEVDFIKIVRKPVPRLGANGSHLIFDGHLAYIGGDIDIVINEKREPYLNNAGTVVGHTAGGGRSAWTVSLTQSDRSGEFLIDNYQPVVTVRGIGSWEKRLGKRS